MTSNNDAEKGIDPLQHRPPAVGDGKCVVCVRPADTGIAVEGNGKWAVTVLMRLGWSDETARAAVSNATGNTREIAPGVASATVPWDEQSTLLYYLCAECGQNKGSYQVGKITSTTIAAPFYKEDDEKNPDENDAGGNEQHA
ncbi:hypothetical protein [Nocardia sp. CA-120079]|uniref:hypothetical protein n=1 Tax=Nocardia sp. CA-120079 TaxID=3239974 RepID=UPI003D99A68D